MNGIEKITGQIDAEKIAALHIPFEQIVSLRI